MAFGSIVAAVKDAAETQHCEIASQSIVPVMFAGVISKGGGPCVCHAAECQLTP